jgi:hypothetical protein
MAMIRKRSVFTFLIALLTANLFFTNCYTQLSPVKNYQQNYAPPQTIKDTTYEDLELNIRFYLHEKYHPGSCYGMPSKDDERIIKSKLKNDPQLVKIIEDRYHVYKDYEVYRILISIKKFLLEKINEGYKFSFTDGECCVITKYVGILYMDNDVIIRSEIISKKISHVPC